MRWVVGWLIGLAVISGSPRRAAAGDATAEQLFREGRALMRAGQLADACERFASSQAREPSVGTLLNLGDCRQRMGQLATAWSTFRAAQELAAERRDRRGPEAGRRAARLEARVSYLTVVLAAPPPGLIVRRDGIVLDPARWNQAAPIDPGDYTLAAEAPGYRPWSSSVRLIAGQRAEVTIELMAVPAPILEVAPVAAVPAIAAPPAAVRVAPPELPLRQLGFGIAVGANHREIPLAGLRAIAGLPLPGGALRGTATVLYSRAEDASLDPIEHTTTLSIAVGADYLWTPLPPLALAVGIGLGFDRDRAEQGAMTTTDLGAWWMLHASPLVVRLVGGHLELGLHTQVVRSGDEWTAIVLTSADVLIR